MLSSDEKKELGITFGDDGEFWWAYWIMWCHACMMNDDRMSYDDFKRNFTDIEICNITLDQFDVDQSGESLQ